MTESIVCERTTMPVSVLKPLLIGLAAFIGLFALINNGAIGNEMVRRYLGGHAVSRVTTAMFLVGLASLALIAWDVLRQRRLLATISLAPAADDHGADRTAVPNCDQLRVRLAGFSVPVRQTWLWRRLFTAVEFVRRNDTVEGLDDEMKYAAESDAEEKHERYSFARIMIWAIPMLGFLGTVIGISEALGGLDIGEGNDFQAMMGGLRGSLYVAFDTTALALTLAIVLMFVQFGVDRAESGLLNQVESRAREELAVHWNITNQSRDAYAQRVEAMGNRVIESSEKLVNRQVKLWRSSIEAAEASWIETVQATQSCVQQSLREALADSVNLLSESFADSIQAGDQAVARRWEQWQMALSENARLLVDQQNSMVDQSKLFSRAVERIGELSETREALQDYLEANPTSDNFADAARQLSTAIRLLEFRFKELDGHDAASTQNQPPAIASESRTRRAA